MNIVILSRRLMRTTNDSNNERLDRAIVQCLRLFAKHGRRIRYQKLIINKKDLNSKKNEKSLKQRFGLG